MLEQDSCRDCGSRDTCRLVYQQLGNLDGPDITIKIVMAFLLPVVFFITCLVILEKLEVNVFGAFISAVTATVLFVLILKITTEKFTKNKK